MNHAFKEAVAAPIRGQSRRRSAIEAGANVIIGYLVAVTANYFVLPAFGYMVTVQDSFTIGLAFTAISMLRTYVLRRLFNRFD
ncbi:MAG: DUF7220 family protein [Alphaproteobacteria bacterium]